MERGSKEPMTQYKEDSSVFASEMDDESEGLGKGIVVVNSSQLFI
jgi:hypothetical protein